MRIKYEVIFLAIPRKISASFNKKEQEIIQSTYSQCERRELLREGRHQYIKEVVFSGKYLRRTFLKKEEIKKGKFFLWNLECALKKKMKGRYANVSFRRVIQYPDMLVIKDMDNGV